jgi:hypothetical protein
MAKTKGKTSRAVYWQKHISKWSESGLSQAEYCRQNNLSAAAFHWWKGELRRKSKTQKDSSISMQFVEVCGVPPARAGRDDTYEVVLSRGRTIRVDRDFDSDVLKRLIAVVES